MLFRKAKPADEDAVAAMYDAARTEFRELGIPQWQAGVPGRESFGEDVARGVSFVLEEEGIVAGTVQIITYEPTYERVDGGAFVSDSYLVVHRVAVSPEMRRRGIAGKMLSEAEKLASGNGKRSLRIDTHKKNFRMRAMLAKNGFREVGVIHLSDGSPRIAYEKIFA